MAVKTIPKATIRPCHNNMPLPGSIYAKEIDGAKRKKIKNLMLLKLFIKAIVLKFHDRR